MRAGATERDGTISSEHHDSTRPVRVAVVNDYAIVMHGLATVLAAFSDRIEVVFVGSQRGDDSADALAGLDVDVVLFDPFGSRQSGSARAAQLVEHPGRKYAVVAWHRSTNGVAEALEMGCAAYLSKRLDPEDLVRAIEDVHAGKRVVSPESAWTRPMASGEWPGQEQGLTARESEVLCLIAQGLTNNEVAERAYIGAESLKTYIRAAYRKIGATRRSQAIIWCLNHGLTTDG